MRSILLCNPRQLVQFRTTTLVIQLTTPHTLIHQPSHPLDNLLRLFLRIAFGEGDAGSSENIGRDRS